MKLSGFEDVRDGTAEACGSGPATASTSKQPAQQAHPGDGEGQP